MTQVNFTVNIFLHKITQMKKLFNTVSALMVGLFLMSSALCRAQEIDINAGYGNYEPAQFPGYGNHPNANGIFYSSAGKTSGVIPPYTAQLTIVLAHEAPWTRESFIMPEGWEMDPASTPTNLTFYNSSAWTTEDPYFEIPVRAIEPRSSMAQSVGTQVFNIAGDWIDDGIFNNTTSTVTVLDSPLPVTLVSFSALKESETALLKWSTTFETNSDYFEVQRSHNGKNWNPIGKVASHRESNSLQEYTFTDTKPQNGENLYRLKMVDIDGHFAYSRIRSASFKNLMQVVVYPNPASDKLLLNNYASVKHVVLHNLQGAKVLDMEKVSSEGINIKHLIPGIYVLKATMTDGPSYTQKIVVSK
jgi:hypothetical protein